MKKTFVISHFGTEARTAQALGLSQPAVNKWPEELPFSAIGRVAVFAPNLLKSYWRNTNKKGSSHGV